ARKPSGRTKRNAANPPKSPSTDPGFPRSHRLAAFRQAGPPRHRPGHWWTATTGDLVGYESWLERDRLLLLDFDPPPSNPFPGPDETGHDHQPAHDLGSHTRSPAP